MGRAGVIETWCRKCGFGEVLVPPSEVFRVDQLRRHLRRCPECGRGGRVVSELKPGPPTQPMALAAWNEEEAMGWAGAASDLDPGVGDGSEEPV